MSKYEKLSSKINALRIESGLLQRDVSELTGIPRGRLSEYENGRRLPSGRNLEKLLDLFEVRADERDSIMNDWKICLCLNPKARYDIEQYREAIQETDNAILEAVQGELRTVIIVDDVINQTGKN